MAQKILINALIYANSKKVWDYYTLPEHIVNWNFADPSWHCPFAENEMKVGGKYLARMEAKDGSFGFDFEAIYTNIVHGKSFEYISPDNRNIAVRFETEDEIVNLTIVFDAEETNPIDLQKAGWQAILNNFKNYVESH